MTRTFLSRTGIAAALGGLALAGFASFQMASPGASAQSAPPDPPVVYYGTATSAPVGANVVSVIENGGQGITCGSGRVLSEGGQVVYAAQVVKASQKAGCATSGSNVRFYVSPGPGEHGEGGRLTAASGFDDSNYAKSHNIVLGAELTIFRAVPMASTDGIP